MFIKPVAPPYDALEWEKKPFAEKARMVSAAWALQGYGTPVAIYIVYALKVALYIGGWVFFCSFTPGMGSLNNISAWWLTGVAFQKAIIWSMLFEVLGLGCGSGPLTGRYLPPMGGALYFLRPGTTKLPVFDGVPIIGRHRRSLLDVGVYAAACAAMVLALTSQSPGMPILLAIVVLVAVAGILDKTLFLAARGEHYWTVTMLFFLSSNWIPGAKAVWVALWFWAGFSKLNHHFPAVVGVMTSNSPFTRFGWIRRRMYRNYPDDLSPSRIATWMGHAGTALELSVPVVLLAGHGGTVTLIGLVMMLALHGFITSNVPMGAPIEWNFMMVYGAFFLFWQNAAVNLTEMSLFTAIFLGVMIVAIPLLGNLFPSRVPFLMAMRYYAGNWAYSIWLFRGESYRKLDKLTKTSPWIYDQLDRLYEHSLSVGVIGKVVGFRLMHLHGRALSQLLPKAVDKLEEYEWADGELVAGLALGWNFGEGHLHSEQMLKIIQEQCGYEEGELRVVMVESQPFGRNTMHYRIHDAKTGLMTEGQLDVAALRGRQPWGLVSEPPSTPRPQPQPTASVP